MIFVSSSEKIYITISSRKIKFYWRPIVVDILLIRCTSLYDSDTCSLNGSMKYMKFSYKERFSITSVISQL